MNPFDEYLKLSFWIQRNLGSLWIATRSRTFGGLHVKKKHEPQRGCKWLWLEHEPVNFFFINMCLLFETFSDFPTSYVNPFATLWIYIFHQLPKSGNAGPLFWDDSLVTWRANSLRMSIGTAATTGQKPKPNLKIEARKGVSRCAWCSWSGTFIWRLHSDCVNLLHKCRKRLTGFHLSKPSRKDLDYLQATGKVPLGGIIMKCSLKLSASLPVPIRVGLTSFTNDESFVTLEPIEVCYVSRSVDILANPQHA